MKFSALSAAFLSDLCVSRFGPFHHKHSVRQSHALILYFRVEGRCLTMERYGVKL